VTGAVSLLDAHFLEGKPPKNDVIARLLEDPAASDAVRPFYDGMRILRFRTPELTLVALRLVLAGHKADDESVTRLRSAIERIREGGTEAEAAKQEYRRILA
jgi:hypothetical protein